MPIRWRLTLWFAFVLGIILVVSGVVLHVVLQQYLLRHVDEELQAFSARIHTSVVPDELPAPVDFEVIHSRLPPINEFVSPVTYIQLIDAGGAVVVKSDSLGRQELPVDLALIDAAFAERSSVKTVLAGDGAPLRIMVSPMHLRNQTLVLEVSQSIGYIETTMAQVRLAVLAGVMLALVAATVSGGVIVRKALLPVSRITRTAHEIGEGGALSRRVGYLGPGDEIGQLASTFDRMIEHLDHAFESQKHFVADASHELRGPLTVIRGNVDLLKRSLTAADRAESLRALEAEATRMSKIVNDLLILANLESGQLVKAEDVSLAELVTEEARRVRSVDGKHHIELAIVEDVVVRADRQRLQQVLGNLVDNAVKYTPEGGRIAVSVIRDGESARLEVLDTGVGIPADALPHIFDRFYRVDKARSRATGGTGLGLAIVKTVVQQHGGKVTVKSEPGKGSTFTVWLKV